MIVPVSNDFVKSVNVPLSEFSEKSKKNKNDKCKKRQRQTVLDEVALEKSNQSNNSNQGK